MYSACANLGCILTSDLVVVNLFMHSLPNMILCTLLCHMFFYTNGVIVITFLRLTIIGTSNKLILVAGKSQGNYLIHCSWIVYIN